MSLEDDVARMLEELKKSRQASFKQLVNDALREGLTRMTQPAPAKERFHTKAVDMGRCSFPNLDNVWEVIAEAEGEWHK